jgi:hydrogenase expression/formation protein HypC
VCIGIPMQVVRTFAAGATADCEGRGGPQRLDLMLVGEQPVGTWVLAFRGAAVRVLTTEEAMQTNAALEALDVALAGGDNFDAYFADLVDREPQLPEHLRTRNS